MHFFSCSLSIKTKLPQKLETVNVMGEVTNSAGDPINN